MAIFYCTTKPLSRSEGRTSVAAAAYRSGSCLIDQRTGELHDYRGRSGVLATEIIVPSRVSKGVLDRADLWNAAEKTEKRRDGRTAREIVLALPSELTAEQNRGLVTAFARKLADDYGAAVDVAVHAPSIRGDQRNIHAHLLMTTRQIDLGSDGIRLTDKTHLEWSDSKRRKNGLSSAADEIKRIRESWAGHANSILAALGTEAAIDARSLKDQGIMDRLPGVHLGPAAMALVRAGKLSKMAEKDAAIQGKNVALQGHYQELEKYIYIRDLIASGATTGFELIPDMSVREVLKHRQQFPQEPGQRIINATDMRQPTRKQQALIHDRNVARVERYLARLEAEREEVLEAERQAALEAERQAPRSNGQTTTDLLRLAARHTAVMADKRPMAPASSSTPQRAVGAPEAPRTAPASSSAPQRAVGAPETPRTAPASSSAPQHAVGAAASQPIGNDITPWSLQNAVPRERPIIAAIWQQTRHPEIQPPELRADPQLLLKALTTYIRRQVVALVASVMEMFHSADRAEREQAKVAETTLSEWSIPWTELRSRLLREGFLEEGEDLSEAGYAVAAGDTAEPEPVPEQILELQSGQAWPEPTLPKQKSKKPMSRKGRNRGGRGFGD